MGQPARPRALVADDSTLVRWALVHALTREGYDVDVAGTRDDCIHRLIEGPYATVIMACALEEVDTKDLLRALADDPRCPTVVVLCVGDCADQTRAEYPGVHVFDMPFSLHAILQVVAPSQVEPVAQESA